MGDPVILSRRSEAQDGEEPVAPDVSSPSDADPSPSSRLAMTAPRERLLALDVFRGATIAGMLLVNDPGSWNAIYAPLEHAEWNGWTPTHLLFPFFLFRSEGQ